MRSQAYGQGIKPASEATDTTFSFPTPNSTGALLPAQLPGLTVDASRRYVPMGGGQLPISQVSDATQASVPEQGGFVFDTLDNPIARARNDQAAERAASTDSAREAARQQLQMLFTREGLASERQNSQQQFTASENAKNRSNQRELATVRAQQAAAAQGTASQPKPTEFNNRAALVAPRAIEAAGLMDRMGTRSNLAAKGAQKLPLIGQFFTSDEQQELEQAGDVLATSILRLESGAAVSEEEAQRYAKQFTPQPFDSDELLAQKANLRRIAVERLRAAAAPVLDREQSRYSPRNPFAQRP